MLLSSLISTALVLSPVKAPVHIQHLEGSHGVSDGYTVLIDPNTPEVLLEYVTVHELGHVLHTKYPRYLRHFGKPPYVTRYARENTYEDFAETYADVIINKKDNTRKHKIILFLLEKHYEYRR